MENQNQESESKRRILVVDDHDFVRRTLRQFIEAHGELTVCGESSSAASAIEKIETSHPDLMLLDLSLGEDDGFELLDRVHSTHAQLPVLVISMHSESLFGVASVRRGARGYLMKSDITEHLYEAVETIFGGGVYISDVLREELQSDSAN